MLFLHQTYTRRNFKLILNYISYDFKRNVITLKIIKGMKQFVKFNCSLNLIIFIKSSRIFYEKINKKKHFNLREFKNLVSCAEGHINLQIEMLKKNNSRIIRKSIE